MWSTSLPSLLGPLCPGVVVKDMVSSMGQTELFDNLNCMQTNDLYYINC